MFREIIQREPSFQRITQRIQKRKTGLIQDLQGGARPLLLWGLCAEIHRHTLMITPGPQEAQELFEDLLQYDGKTVLHFPAQEVLPHERIPSDISLRRERQEVLETLLFQEGHYIIVTSIQALLQGLIPPSIFQKGGWRLEQGKVCDSKECTAHLVQTGYERVHQVEHWGEFSVRGGIMDVFPLTAEHPVRIEFFDDEVDSIRSFDLVTQRSLEMKEEVLLTPARETFFLKNQLDKGQQAITEDSKKMKGDLLARGQGQEARELEERVQKDLEELRTGNMVEGLRQYLPYLLGTMGSLMDYVEPNPLILLDRPEFVASRAQNFLLEMGETQVSLMEQGSILPRYSDSYHDLESILGRMAGHGPLLLGELPPEGWDMKIHWQESISCNRVGSYGGRLDEFVKEVKKELQDGYQVILTLNSKAKCRKMSEYLQEHKLDYTMHLENKGLLASGMVNLYPATIREGFSLPGAGVILHTEEEVLGKQKVRKKKVQDLQEGARISSVDELKTGDYVVHENHGIGRYLGVRTQEVLGVHQDYLVVKYAGEDRLYVPTHQVHLIQKYIGAEEQAPRLYRLGGSDWNRVKKKVKESVQELAFGLLNLYAEREALQGHSFAPDTVWQKEFEEAFPFQETPDQLRAIQEIKVDMEDERAMDRLLCGDVGYGKTEVAIRASFKSVMDGKQVALLVPTTILAQQHFNTFMDRFEEYPIEVEMLSRFRSAKQQKLIMKELRKGGVDIIIGTHRLLSRDLQFKDLGLLIIDEEQRFGVAHKERLKEMKKNVDVLTLTATPIPRTLHMSMVGVRDMSVIETPPQDRYPIRTYVREFNKELIRDAVQREMARGGQVYFVHNRVEDIRDQADDIQRLIPQARIAVAHGQMPEAQLEKIMVDFLNRHYDVLVCTTIIETGMDIPNVNTIIVNNADYMGLAQLYQLRGRVGRSNRVAYAYLLYRTGKVLSEISEKRLRAIKEFTNLGSGFKLAMRDLEIRGAGNLLGPEQHGHIAAIGFSLYCKLLEEAVQELQGREQKKRPEDVIVETDWDAYIPESYLADTAQKIEVYKKINRITDDEDYQDLLDELIDRFGDPPTPVMNLLHIARLRVMATEKKLQELRLKNGRGQLILSPEIPDLGEKIISLGRKYDRRLRIKGSKHPQLHLNLEGLEDQKVQEVLEDVLINL